MLSMERPTMAQPMQTRVAPLIPPKPDPAPEQMRPLDLARRMRTNGITVYAPIAYEEEVLQRAFFGRSSFLLNAPDAIRHVLVDQHDNYGRTNATLRVLSPLLGKGLFLSEGRDWRHQRRTLAPAFTPKAISLLVPHMLSPINETVTELQALGDEPANLFAAVQRLALEIAARTMFSLEMRQNSPALRDFVVRYGQGLARTHLLDVVLPLSVPSPFDLGRLWFSRRWMRFFEQLMAERHRSGPSPEKPRDLFDLLLASRDPETGRAFSATQLRDQAATMILAGHETTAVALSWALYLLALAPESQERVAQEATQVPLNGEGAAALERLTYTRAVLDEAMRLYPPAYVIVRTARVPDEVAGLGVRSGDLMVVSPWVLHRHRRRWANPDAFDPERFLPGGPGVDRYAYLPFGVGPRICIGAHFALTEATLVLARLLQSFRIELVSSAPVTPVAIVTTQPDHQPWFRLKPR
jgi:cytochrome P450